MLFVVAAILLQLFVAVQAWRMARSGIGSRPTWLVVGGGIGLMALLRGLTLLQALRSPPTPLFSTAGAIEFGVALILAIGLTSLPRGMVSRARATAAERAVEQSEARTRRIVETSIDGVWLVDREGRTTYANQRMATLLGTTPAEMIGTHLVAYLPESARPRAAEYLARGIEEQHELELRTIDGRALHTCIAATPLLTTEGEYDGAVAFITDFTDERATEAALRESEERFRQFAEQSPQVFWFTQLTPERVLYVSPAFEEIWGLSAETLYRDSRLWLSAIVPEDRDAVHHAWSALLESRGEAGYEVEYRILRPDGMTRWICDAGTLIRDAAGVAVRVAGIATDVTERRGAELSARAVELQFRSLVEAFPLPIVALTATGEVTGWNPAAERVFGYTREEVLHHHLPIVPPERRDEYARNREEVLQGQAFSGRLTQRQHKNGATIEVMISTARVLDRNGLPSGLVAIYQDMTERRQLEERQHQLQLRLTESRKLESLGVLAGGIAHDFNNLLTIIQVNTQLARGESAPAAPVHTSLRQIETAASRAAELTAQMLTYAGKGRFQVAPQSLTRLVEEQREVLQGLVPAGATLRMHRLADPVPIVGDPEQLRQLLVNLVTNAAEALDAGGGTIEVSTGLCLLDEAMLEGSLFPDQMPPGQCGFLEVTDTGSGMEPQMVGRMFEPFVSSRFAGRGLGLAAVAGIIRRHHGTATVESAPGRGTSLRIYLPVPATTPDRAERRAEPAGTVLLVDDEQEVLRLMGRFLELAGFEVHLAPGGAEAVALFEEHRDAIDVVILDLTMPGMSGDQALAALRKLDPDLPAILTSGYTRSEVMRRCAGMRISAFLLKPYLPGELTAQVQAVIKAGRPHPADSLAPESR